MSTNYYFKSLNFENYRGIEKLSFPNLRRVNIIGGLNGVGKTTVLEGIFLLLARGNPLVFNRPFVARQTKLPFPNGFDYVFYNFDTSKTIKIYGQTQAGNISGELKKSKIHDLQINSPNTFSPSNDFSDSSVQSNSIEFKLKIGGQPQSDELIYFQPTADNISLNAKRLTIGSTPFCAFASLTTLNIVEDAQRYSVLVKEKRTGQLFEYLRLLYPDLRNIQLLQELGAPILYVEFSDGSLVQSILLGGGFQMMLSIALLMMTARNGIFLFDEVDNTIHHSLLGEFWALVSKLASTTNGQVFAVTHSRECIGAAVNGFRAQGNLADLAYFRLEEGGREIKCISYDGDDLEEALSSNWEMR